MIRAALANSQSDVPPQILELSSRPSLPIDELVDLQPRMSEEAANSMAGRPVWLVRLYGRYFPECSFGSDCEAQPGVEIVVLDLATLRYLGSEVEFPRASGSTDAISWRP